MIARLVDRMQEGRVPLQILATLASAPLVMALMLLTFLPLVVEIAFDGLDPERVDVAVQGVRAAILAIVACGIVTAGAAALVLRSFLRASVDRIRVAAEAIAAGNFSHRVGSPRHDELGSLAAAIDGTALRLERLEQARRQTLACVSHELRTPVTIARSAAYTLARTEADPVRRERFELVDDELARLASLIDDLVDTASIHAGGVRLDRERVDLVEQLEAAADRFEGAAAERGIQVRMVHPARRRGAYAEADVDRVQQVVGNLLANAVRHAHDGTSVEIAIRPADGEGDAHVVTVTNEGPAIPRELHERIFEPFVQHGTRSGRAGLGLAIARDLVEAHGGTLGVVPTGASNRVCFRLTLPSAPDRSRADRRRSERAAALPRRRPMAVPDTEFAT